MSKVRVAAALALGIAAFAPHTRAQAPQKPSPYTGVSQPPPDDTITADDATPATPKPAPTPNPSPTPSPNPSPAPVAKLLVRPAAVTPPPMVVTTPAANCNPDDRMVGDPSPCADPAATAAPNASPNPNSNPDADIVASVPSRPGELPEGTVIRIALGQDLSSSESLPGSDFTGKIAADVLSEGKVVIPQGAEVLGKIVRVAEGRRFGAPATIRLRPDVVVLPDGSRYVLRAQVIAAGAKARVDDEGALQPASRIKANALKEGVGIGAGAVAGALVAGAPGALVGSLVGAGVMTTHILVQHPAAVRIPQGSTLTLSLTQPMAITPEIASN